MIPLEDLLYESRDGVGVLTFNRPARLNACRVQTYRELHAAVDEVGRDDAVRVLVLRGAGRAFCVGDDLKEARDLLRAGTPLDQWREEVERLQDITRRIVQLPKPVIAAVHGHAVGFGAEVAIASDIRVAADDVQFLFTEVTRGLYPTNGVLYRLPRLVGHGRAAEWLLTGSPIPAAEALAAGLVTHLVPGPAMLTRVLDVAARLAANAPIPLRLLKRHLAMIHDVDFEAGLRLEVDGLLQCIASEDVVEGMRAFAEKRRPVYRGR
jgi:enoyl-CoA hydratase/carnithine racemase